MKTIHLTILFLTLLFTTSIYGQSELEILVDQGVQYHDMGDFDKAIDTYKKALKIDPKSALVNYEIALSLFSKGDYKESEKYSKEVLKQNKDFMLEAYIINGSALDMLGKTNESIELFEKAIKKTKGSYLLYYNLALNYYKINNLDKAEENVINAIEMNPNHSSSHLMLAHIENQKGNPVQALLASHYFLLLEPISARSKEGYDLIQKNFKGNVREDKDNPKNITILVSPDENNEFSPVELMISMLAASKTLEDNKDKTEDEMFVENTESFFKVLGELKKPESKGIWWNFYTDFFYSIAKSDYIETYCKYISQVGSKNSKDWIAKNESQLNDFSEWLKEL